MTTKQTMIKELQKWNQVLTEHQKMHIAVILEMSLKQLRVYLSGSVAKEKTGREILAAVKKMIGSKVSKLVA